MKINQKFCKRLHLAKKYLLIFVALCLTACATACRFSPDEGSDLTTDPTVTDPTRSETTASETSETTESTEPSSLWWEEWALARFLTEVNYSGTILSSGTVEAPGTLPEVEYIPKADQSLVGESVTVIFAQEQERIPFYYCYDADTGWERLAVAIHANIPLLIIFETELGGVTELCKAIAEQRAFDATVLSMTNISSEEGTYYLYSAGRNPAESQRIDIFSDSLPGISGQYIGVVGTVSDGETKNILAYADAEEVADDLSIWLRVFTRFGLTDIACQS